MIDSRALPDLAPMSPPCRPGVAVAVLVFAESDKTSSHCLKRSEGSNVFAVLPVPVDAQDRRDIRRRCRRCQIQAAREAGPGKATIVLENPSHRSSRAHPAVPRDRGGKQPPFTARRRPRARAGGGNRAMAHHARWGGQGEARCTSADHVGCLRRRNEGSRCAQRGTPGRRNLIAQGQGR